MIDTSFGLTTAGEYASLGLPRECTLLGELKCREDGGTAVLIKITPPFSDERLSPPAKDEDLLLMTRHFGTYSLTADRLRAITDLFPVRVYRLGSYGLVGSDQFNVADIQGLGAGLLFRSEESALKSIEDLGFTDVDRERYVL